MVAVGYNSKGERIEFPLEDGYLFCSNKDLVSLIVPTGCIYLSCSNNLLTVLIIPIGCEFVSCWNNKLFSLDIPSSVKELFCNKEVKGLELFIDKVKIALH